MNLYKKCSKCNELKNIEDFSFRGETTKDGKRKRRNTCKDCEKKYKYAKRHPVNNVDTKINAVDAVLSAARYDPDRLNQITTTTIEKYVSGVKIDDSVLKKATEVLVEKGLYSPETITIDKGNVLICGDSFGKHTKTKMFTLMNKLIKSNKIDTVVHVGEALDDDNEVSNLWGTVDARCIFVAKSNELEELYKQQIFCGFDIVQNNVNLFNEINVVNQEVIQPYTRTSINTLDQYVYNSNTVCNCTRHEYFQRNKMGGNCYIASPGTMAKPFVKQTITKLSFVDGIREKLCYTKNFIKYRRMKEVADNYWQSGFIIVDEHRNINMIRVKYVNGEYECVFNGKFYSSDSIDKKITTSLVCADFHAPNENSNLIDSMDSYLNEHNIKVDRVVALGDIVDGRPANPHVTGVQEGDLLDELRSFNRVLSFLARYTKQRIVLEGNHENFYERFLSGFPAFQKMLNIIVDRIVRDNDFYYYREKNPYSTANTSYWHGSAKYFGQSGTTLEKNVKNFSRETVVIGHTHSPQIRYDGYCTPCMCKKDQGYNNPSASNWASGFAVVYETEESSYCQLIIFNDKDLCHVVGTYNRHFPPVKLIL